MNNRLVKTCNKLLFIGLLLTFPLGICMAGNGFSSSGEGLYESPLFQQTEPSDFSGIYVPFESPGTVSATEEPVLYGPGGDPIGGLPVGNGVWILFGSVFIYALGKVYQKSRNNN
jgi:hypothetical protein